MRTVKRALAPRAGVETPHVSTPVAIAQTGVVGVWEATVQVVPALVGTVSVMVKPWVSSGRMLVTRWLGEWRSEVLSADPVTPLTSAVLVREMFGQLTVM